MDHKRALLRLYRRMDAHFGPLHWWPAQGPFEVMVGTILTQNTAWINVEKAIRRLKQQKLLSPQAIAEADGEVLAEAIRSSGFYRLKAQRLKSLVRFFLTNYDGDCGRMAAAPLPILRDQLLAVTGVGPETADSILLYACGLPSFVSDAYTKRILSRHGLVTEAAPYDQIRGLFMAHLPADVALFNQYHALLVNTGKHFCRKEPRCGTCPLGDQLPEKKPRRGLHEPPG